MKPSKTSVETGTSVTDHFAAWLRLRGELVVELYPHTAPVWRSRPATADMLRRAYYAEHPGLL